MADEGDGYTGKAIPWSVFVRPHQSSKKMFGRRQEVPAPAGLTGAIEAALMARGIEVQRVGS